MQETVGIVGAVTMVTGALLGITQWDIKRILAYSTMSQIGYMIMGVGVGAYQAGVLHFFTHAFFKAQLFLAAGLVIHALHDEQDVRKMGGLRQRMPFAFWAMLVGTLAIIGFPGLSGYFSKDAVIYGALEHGHPVLYIAGVLTAGLTAYYMFRMIFLTFFGPYRVEAGVSGAQSEGGQVPDHAGHAPAWVMQLPVALLIVPTILAGYLNVSFGGGPSPWMSFFGPLFSGSNNVAGPVLQIPEFASGMIVLVFVAAGIVVAYLRYGAPAVQAAAVERLEAETRAIPQAFRRGFYFDDVIEMLVVKPSYAIGRAIAGFIDPHVIDAGVRDVVWVAGALGAVFRRLQTGLVRGYALTIVAGAAAFIAYFALIGAAR
jgi:NADH-quinone oxidoreductase subunit L